MEICTHLRRWWPALAFHPATDPAYLAQIAAYGPDAEHDDAPDSAASVVRAVSG